VKPPSDLYRELPSVDELLHNPRIEALISQEGQAAVTDACRVVLGRLREEISASRLDSEKMTLALSEIHSAIETELRRTLGYSLRPVINATGVILHTNLGRAPLADTALDHIRETAGTYSNLEFDLETGERGKRDVHVDRLFRKLLSEQGRAGTPAAPQSQNDLGGTGVLARPEHGSAGRPTPSLNKVQGTPIPTRENPDNVGTAAPGCPAEQRSAISTIVVNNNAAAVLLALNTLAEDGEVIVSRGELVEIGGSFRIPDVMAKSGAILCEVGTTNRTRIADYERAINERTKLLLRVHRSNFEITGFTEQPLVPELVALAQKHKLPLMEDLGSGALFDLGSVGINDEPGVLDSLRAGMHVVTYSGDKLLGGPQAGLISGREDLVRKMRANSLFRALRVDKLTYAALEATLVAYVKKDYDSVPALQMMQTSKKGIAMRAQAVISGIRTMAGEGARPTLLTAELIPGESLIGGGSAPSAVLPTILIALTCYSLSASELAARLRASDPPVIARVEEGRVLLDLRTVFPSQDEVVARVLSQVLAQIVAV
jgi:L-seryl-tRNA(Ser) seleniumtransferase